MTRRQKQCLDFIEAYIKRRGYAPTNQEIQLALGLFYRSEAMFIVDCLVERGHLFKIPNKVRGLSIFQEVSRGPDGITMYAAWPS